MIYEDLNINVDGNKLISDANSLCDNLSSRKSNLQTIYNSLNSDDWDAQTMTTIKSAIFKLIGVCDLIANYLQSVMLVGKNINDCKNLISSMKEKYKKVQELSDGSCERCASDSQKLKDEISKLAEQFIAKMNTINNLIK